MPLRYRDRQGKLIDPSRWLELTLSLAYRKVEQTRQRQFEVTTWWVGCACDCERQPAYFITQAEPAPDCPVPKDDMPDPVWSCTEYEAHKAHEKMVKRVCGGEKPGNKGA